MSERRHRAPAELARRAAPPKPTFSVVIAGAGKVGTSFATGLRALGVPVRVVSVRTLLAGSGTRARLGRPSLAIIASRDAQIADVASALAARLPTDVPLVHTAGAFGPEALDHVAARGFPTAQMHPLLSFAPGRPPSFRGATLLVDGHPRAVRAARRLARLLGLVPRSFPTLPRALYHASAALLANGAAALAEAACELLERGGVPRDRAQAVAPAMLGPLLQSVAANLSALGLPQALSGPVRRGDVGVLDAHWAEISRASPEVRDLYRAVVRVQIDMARALGETSSDALRTMLSRVALWGAAGPAKTSRIKTSQRSSKRPENPKKRLG